MIWVKMTRLESCFRPQQGLQAATLAGPGGVDQTGIGITTP